MNLHRISITRGPVILVAVVLVCAWGIKSYIDIPKREYPNVEFPVCIVITIWPGAAPEKIERMISEKIEDAVRRVENIEKTQSLSRTGISLVYAFVDTGKLFLDKEEIWDDVRKEVDRIKDQMPEGLAFGPYVNDRYSKVKSMLIGVSSADVPYQELADYAEALQDEIKYLKTVNRCELSGRTREIICLTADERLERYDVTLWQVFQALKARNITMGGGVLSISDNQMIIEPSGEFKSLEDIADVIVTVSPESGHPVYVRDLFTVSRGLEDPPVVMAHVNGNPAVVVDVELREGENVLEMGRQVYELVRRAEATFPSTIAIDIIADKAMEVKEKLNDFKSNLYQGIILVVAVALLCIGLKPAIIMASTIPLSLLVTFGCLPVLGYDLENMTITGLIVAIGMIVDNSVVITDNIYRYMIMGYERLEAGWKGASEVAIPMLSATATTVAAFLPLAFIPGTVGEFIRSIPVAVVTALILSYLIAMTVTPWMSARLIRVRAGLRDPDGMPGGAWTRIINGYERIIVSSLKRPRTIVLAALVAFIAALLLIPMLGFQFFPLAEKDLFVVEVWTPEGTDVPGTRAVAAEVESILAEEPAVLRYLTYSGKGSPRIEIGLIKQEELPNYAMIWVRTRDWRITNDIIPGIRDKVRRRIAGARVEVKCLETGPPVGAPVQFNIEGDDIEVLRRLSEKTQAIIAAEPGVFAVHDDFGTDAYKIEGRFDEDEIKRTGLTNQEIALVLMANFSGIQATSFREEDKSIPVKIRAGESRRDDYHDLLETRVRSSLTGKTIAIKQVADIQAVPYVPVIRHTNGRRTLKVKAFVEEGVLADDIVKKVWPVIRRLERPEGYELSIAGEYEEREKAFSHIGQAFVTAVLLMILMLMLNFNSVARTLIIFSTVPLSLVGSVIGLFITGYPFGFMAFLGVVALSGIVVNNAIILIDFIDHAIKRGVPVREALSLSGKLRLRPIIVTTATTIGGLLPLGFRGGVIFAPMAWVIVFGLAVSTLLTLVVVPNLYFFILGRRPVQRGNEGAA